MVEQCNTSTETVSVLVEWHETAKYYSALQWRELRNYANGLQREAFENCLRLGQLRAALKNISRMKCDPDKLILITTLSAAIHIATEALYPAALETLADRQEEPRETTEHQLPPHDYTHPDWQGNGVTKFWTEDSLRAYAAVAARSPEEPDEHLPHGFISVPQCAGCGVQDQPGARHFSECPACPGELVRPSKATGSTVECRHENAIPTDIAAATVRDNGQPGTGIPLLRCQQCGQLVMELPENGTTTQTGE